MSKLEKFLETNKWIILLDAVNCVSSAMGEGFEEEYGNLEEFWELNKSELIEQIESNADCKDYDDYFQFLVELGMQYSMLSNGPYKLEGDKIVVTDRTKFNEQLDWFENGSNRVFSNYDKEILEKLRKL